MQSEWRWCKKCQGLAFSQSQPSVCPAGGSHDHSASGNYALAHNDPSARGQSEWRWCRKCQGLAFSQSQPSVCPAGGSHDHSQSGNYTLAHGDPSAPGQTGWRWCKKCQGLAFSLNQPSVCPAGGSHDHSASGDYTLTPAQAAATEPASKTPLTRIATRKPSLRRGMLSGLLPTGASLFYMDGDIALNTDFPAQGKTVRFYWNVSKVPNAQGATWQVTQAPFGSFRPGEDPAAIPIVASGKGTGAQGSFEADFAKLPRLPSRTGVNNPLWHVRVLPIGSAGAVVGQPSNVIRVYDRVVPVGEPLIKSIDMGQWYVQPGIPIRMTHFESVPYRYNDDWPPGCEHYKGAGYQLNPLSWIADTVGDALDWTSQAYEDAQNYVVTGVVTIFPFVPREVAKFALQAALTAAGIPPSIPNLNQMLTNGSDYLADQMVDELAKKVPAGSELAALGKEELRKRLREQTAQAIRDTAAEIVEPGADSKYCVGKEYPPILKLTLQNVGSKAYTDVAIKLDYVDSSDPSQPALDHWLTLPRESYLLLPFAPMHIAHMDPLQSLTIPVDIFSHMNIAAVPRDKTLSDSTKDYGHWKTYYQYSQFRFTVDGGRTVRYRAKSQGGVHLEEQLVDDGVGFSWKSPKRQWLDERFEWSAG